MDRRTEAGAVEVACVLVSLRKVVWGRSWLRGRDRVLSESEPGPGSAGLNHVDVTKWSNGGRLRGVRVGAVRWAWRNSEDVPRVLKGVTAALAIGPDAVGVGP